MALLGTLKGVLLFFGLLILIGVFTKNGPLVFIGITFGFIMFAILISSQTVTETIRPIENPRNRYVSKNVQERVLARQRGRCAHPQCRVNYGLEKHHIIPVSKGGLGTEDNIVFLCPNHHAEVGRQMMIQENEYKNGVKYGEIL